MATTSPFFLEPGNRDFLRDDGARAHSLKNQQILLWIMVTVDCLLVAAVVWACQEWVTWYRLRHNGAAASGRVTALDEDFDGDGTTSYYVSYELELDGKPVPRSHRKAEVARAYYERLKVGSEVPVRFLPESPEVSRLVEDRHWLSMATGVAAVCLLAALVFLVLALVIRRRLRLLRRGQVLSGKLLSCRGATDSENDFCLHATFNFVTPADRIIQGKQTVCRNDMKDQALPQPGTPIAVLYLNDGNFEAL
jgi:hypothetical protein